MTWLANLVNEYDIDVFVKYKPSSSNLNVDELESGWNIVSQKSLELVSLRNDAKLVYSKPFKLKVNLEKKSDVMRSWTENNLSGTKDLFNALHIRQPYKIVVIEKLPQI